MARVNGLNCSINANSMCLKSAGRKGIVRENVWQDGILGSSCSQCRQPDLTLMPESASPSATAQVGPSVHPHGQPLHSSAKIRARLAYRQISNKQNNTLACPCTLCMLRPTCMCCCAADPVPVGHPHVMQLACQSMQLAYPYISWET